MAALAIGLVVVWGPALKQIFGGASGSASPAKPVTAAKPAKAQRAKVAELASNSSNASARVEQPSRRPRERPTITIAEAAAYDPFAPPAWVPKSGRMVQSDRSTIEPGELELRFRSLRQAGVAMILVTSSGQAAQVGDRTLYVGDTIDGFEVVEINAQGVTFKPAPSDPEGDARGA